MSNLVLSKFDMSKFETTDCPIQSKLDTSYEVGHVDTSSLFDYEAENNPPRCCSRLVVSFSVRLALPLSLHVGDAQPHKRFDSLSRS